jgi:membrane-associated phospholipid phosphatase
MRAARSAARVEAGFAAIILASAASTRGFAQEAIPSAPPTKSGRAAAVASALLLSAAAAFDAKLERYAVAHRSATLDRVALAVDPLGRAQYIVPTLAAGYLVSRLAGRRSLAGAVVRVTAGYAAADAIEAILKPVVGRRRPAAGDASAFHPFARRDEWHSFPSAHTVHATALAAAISAETQRPWVTGIGLGAAALVGVQRVYTGAHWPSDVVAGAIIGVAASRQVVRMLRS